MVRIAPSILSADFTRLGEEIRAAESAGADMLHIDIMDGHFVPNITIGPSIVATIKKVTRLPLDVHLMISEPDRYINDFVNAGADILTVHIEAAVHLHRTVHFIKDSGIKAGLSLNPATPLCGLDYILQDLDLVLLMSVNPGFGGQTFIPQVLSKIKAIREIIRKLDLQVLIEVDGGIKYENAKNVAEAGADILVMGSAFFGNGNYRELASRLKKMLND